MVGLDAGVAKLATLSDGTVLEPVNSFQKTEDAGETSATVKPQGQIQQQLAEAETQNTATAFLYRKYPQGLPSQSHNGRQQKPRNDSH